MATTNPPVKDLMQVLLDQHGALLAKLDQVTDSKLGDAIVAKAQEILNRINLTQNLLLVAATQELTDAVAAERSRAITSPPPVANLPCQCLLLRTGSNVCTLTKLPAKRRNSSGFETFRSTPGELAP